MQGLGCVAGSPACASAEPGYAHSHFVSPACGSAVPKVLIADNDVAVSALLRDVLERSGLSVDVAFDGESARRMASDPAVDVLVCDLDMPLTSGLDVLAALALLATPPAVVVVSGYVDQAVLDQLREWQFVREVLRKPFDLLAFARSVAGLARGAGGLAACAASRE